MIEAYIKFESADDDLVPSPIDPSWVLEGSPMARIKLMSGSSDGMAQTVIWDCTAGQFEWRYWCDETACVLSGSVVVKDQLGVPRLLTTGDTMFFPKGSRACWTVGQYVRKVAILRQPIAPALVYVARAHGWLKRALAGGKPGPTMGGI